MPEMDGIQALKKFKEADAGANVIMCLQWTAGDGY